MTAGNGKAKLVKFILDGKEVEALEGETIWQVAKRLGTEKAAELMARGPWDAALLDELSTLMRDASICGLGQAAPNPLLCVLKYFPDELKTPLGHW